MLLIDDWSLANVNGRFYTGPATGLWTRYRWRPKVLCLFGVCGGRDKPQRRRRRRPTTMVREKRLHRVAIRDGQPNDPEIRQLEGEEEEEEENATISYFKQANTTW